MRSVVIAITALLLAAACASLAGRGSGVGSVSIRWQESTTDGANDTRQLILFPKSALLSQSAADVLAHPIVADAANTSFRPVLATGTSDLIRITSTQGADLVTPLRTDVGVGPLLQAMTAALRGAHRDVPEYLTLVADEYAPAKRETARFAVTCYWKGEQKLGALPGVIATRTGSLDGEEVIEAEFDPTRVSRDSLAGLAKGMSCYRKTVDNTAAPLDVSNQQQYHLWLNKSWHFVPLTQLQATRVNAALVARESPERFLSPTQLAIQKRLQRAYDRDSRSLDTFESLNVDRTERGLKDYSNALAKRMGSL